MAKITTVFQVELHTIAIIGVGDRLWISSRNNWYCYIVIHLTTTVSTARPVGHPDVSCIVSIGILQLLAEGILHCREIPLEGNELIAAAA